MATTRSTGFAAESAARSAAGSDESAAAATESRGAVVAVRDLDLAATGAAAVVLHGFSAAPFSPEASRHTVCPFTTRLTVMVCAFTVHPAALAFPSHGSAHTYDGVVTAAATAGDAAVAAAAAAVGDVAVVGLSFVDASAAVAATAAAAAAAGTASGNHCLINLPGWPDHCWFTFNTSVLAMIDHIASIFAASDKLNPNINGELTMLHAPKWASFASYVGRLCPASVMMS